MLPLFAFPITTSCVLAPARHIYDMRLYEITIQDAGDVAQLLLARNTTFREVLPWVGAFVA